MVESFRPEGRGVYHPNETYTGQFHRATPRRVASQAFSTKLPIGVAGDYFTALKVWVNKATFAWPTVSVYLGLKNGRGDCYAKTTPAEIRSLAAWLVLQANLVEDMLPGLQIEQTQIEGIIREGQARAAQRIAMEPDGDYE